MLDQTGIHPERYTAVRDMSQELGVQISQLIGEGAKKLLEVRTKWAVLVGEFTFDDIIRELEKPGRDPRDPFKVFAFRDDIFEMKDLKAGMICPGIVSNVTNFGAFVDIGVHQDGLVHLSQLSHQFIDDPRKVVNPGDQVTVKVLTVDLDKKQISLTMLLDERPKQMPRQDNAENGDRPRRPRNDQQRPRQPRAPGIAAEGGGQRPSGPRDQNRGPRPGGGGPRRDKLPPKDDFIQPAKNPNEKKYRQDFEEKMARPEGQRPPRDDQRPRGDRPERGPRKDRAEETPIAKNLTPQAQAELFGKQREANKHKTASQIVRERLAAKPPKKKEMKRPDRSAPVEAPAQTGETPVAAGPTDKPAQTPRQNEQRPRDQHRPQQQQQRPGQRQQQSPFNNPFAALINKDNKN